MVITWFLWLVVGFLSTLVFAQLFNNNVRLTYLILGTIGGCITLFVVLMCLLSFLLEKGYNVIVIKKRK